jgi:hypothetical protein
VVFHNSAPCERVCSTKNEHRAGYSRPSEEPKCHANPQASCATRSRTPVQAAISDPYIGPIEVFGFDFAPKGWAVCAGQITSIAQNAALFSVIGTTFGGGGITDFALPDLRGRTPIGQGNGYRMTPRGVDDAMGEENHTLPRIPLCPTA